jgi:hypothetical protein
MKTFKDFMTEGTKLVADGPVINVHYDGKHIGNIFASNKKDTPHKAYSKHWDMTRLFKSKKAAADWLSQTHQTAIKEGQGVLEGADQKKPTLPPHLLKLIKDKQLDKKPMVQTSKVKDVTPKGYGPNEETNTDRFKKYTRPVVKTTPKIEKDTNPSGRTTDHVEWKVTTHTGEVHRHKTKKEAQAHFDSLPK